MTSPVQRTTVLFMVFPLALAAQFTLSPTATTPAPAPASDARRLELELTGDQAWIDTKMDVAAGDVVSITASGALQYQAVKAGPEGAARTWFDLVKALPLNDVGRGAVIGRIGDSAAARPFLIGPRRESKIPIAGRLWIGLNQSGNEKGAGSFKVVIDRTPAEATRTEFTGTLPKFTQELVDKIPLRVKGDDGTPGDRTNFVVIGSEDRLKKSLLAAGWVIVDRSVKDTILRGALATFSKQAYVTLPMSMLFLFDRPQDYGFAHADPVRVVAARHHFRVWKAPFDVEGQTLWVGAGTHDVGFDRDQRNGKLTHKIDPDTDKERDYIGQTMFETGNVAKLDYITPSSPLTKAKTAHGQEFHSDGRTLIIYMKPDESDVSQTFSDYFCSTLKQNPDGGEWGPCSLYLETPGKDDLALPPLPTKYRVAIVPGIFSSCASNAPAFLEGQKALRDKGLSVDLIEIPNDSSEANAKMIGQFLRDQRQKDDRKFIMIGYSKGTPDLQVALATEEGVRDSVAAFIAVAGASGGSPIADVVPKILERFGDKTKVGGCKGDLTDGLKSLKQEARKRFLASFPSPFVPTYSLPAVSDESNTSKALLNGWQLMKVFDKFQDGQLTKADAVVPGSKFLGAARADHLAVALPFDKVAEDAIKQQMDKARYPRAALLEALIRFVVNDLEPKK